MLCRRGFDVRPCLKVLGAITRAFSAVLAHMDRNSGLKLLQGDHVLCETWLELFKVTARVWEQFPETLDHGGNNNPMNLTFDWLS